jgi:alpha,alpha-trehalase
MLFNNSLFSNHSKIPLFHYSLLVGFFLLSPIISFPQDSLYENISVKVKTTLDSLVYDEDTDGDKKITIDDPHITGTERGDKRFWIKEGGNKRYEVSGIYFLSNLLQELKLAEEAGKDSIPLDAKKIFEPPADRISRMIREYYWDGLTRRIDEKGLLQILEDEKTKTVDGNKYVYVPPSDNLAYNYFSGIAKKYSGIKVIKLADSITGDYVHSLNGYHGLLTLALEKIDDKVQPLPFVVPGGRFNEMYGWDSYFITLGLLQDNRVDLAKAMVDNFVYEISHYGKILNANRTYYLTRSQPPFLTSMIRAVLEYLPKDSSTQVWLHKSLEAAIKEYNEVWLGKDHLTPIGLSRYFDIGSGIPPEVEPGHFDEILIRYAKRHNIDVSTFEQEYKSGKIKEPELDEYFIHDRAMRESGHDTSYRLIGVCAYLTTVDLNSLLYKFETDIAALIEQEFGGSFTAGNRAIYKAFQWLESAEKRKELINHYLWDDEKGMFFDYNYVEKKQTGYVSATTFYPLWAGLASKQQAALIIQNALPLLECAGGITGSTEESRGPISEERPLRQWDYPFGWAPHQMLAWQGLLNYGYGEEAQRLIYRWIYTLTSNAAKYNGTIPEKFDVVNRSHDVFAEYGNVGTKFSYITREGFGWTNASFQVGLNLLPPSLRSRLNELIPPEWIF